MCSINFRRGLMLGGASAVLGLAGGAYAQERPAADTNTLEQVVVTATRQADTVNRVPLAVSAQTQRSLDQQGIRTIADLQQTVPGLQLQATEGAGLATITIRGIRQTVGAATTGFYLDETALQKRAGQGVESRNGTPIPPLFDLERVEVLRGPQGTLFGGSSEGGTVRYIQPQPSLTRYSSYARAEVSNVNDGGTSYEGGVAVGGPIVQDKLGFRASVFARHTGGWLDLVDYRTGQVYNKDSNDGKTRMGRLALTWAPTANSKITASWFSSFDQTHNNSTSTTLSLPGVVTAPSLCWNLSVLPPQVPAFVKGVIPPALGPGATCPHAPGFYVTPGFTVGPLNLKRDQSLATGPTPTSVAMNVASLDAEVDIGHGLTFRSITSYVSDIGKGSVGNAFNNGLISFAPGGGFTYAAPGQPTVNFASGFALNPNVTASVNGNTLGNYHELTTRNTRRAFSQEFRLSSIGEDKRVTWVAGAYFSNTRLTVKDVVRLNELGYIQQAGSTVLQRFGVPNPGYFAYIYETDKDVEIAAFGEATVKINEHLRAIGGIRVTHVSTSFFQTNYGPNSFNVAPSTADGSQVTGQIVEDPVTPKFVLQYLMNPDNMVYASASRGFRAGGVNQVLASVGQGLLFLQYGLHASDLNRTFESDTVWNYELGGKFRLWQGRAQLNLAAYRIDWRNVQSVIDFGDSFIVNAPSARSQGFEAELQVRPIRSLTLNGSASYSKAKYTSDYVVPARGTFPLLAVQDGQRFPLPEWTANFGARYDVELGPVARGYVRGDFRWAKSYQRNPPGAPAYTPDANIVPASKNLNLRAGVEYKELDINVFVNNVTNEDDGLKTGGRSTCTNVSCSTFNNFTPIFTVVRPTPRTIGVQVAYRR